MSMVGEEWQGKWHSWWRWGSGSHKAPTCGLTPLFSERYFSHFCVNPRPIIDGTSHDSFKRSDGIYIYTCYLNIQIQFCIPNVLFLKVFFFWCGDLESLFEFVIILFLFNILVFWPGGMWDLSSLTRDRTCNPCIGSGSLSQDRPMYSHLLTTQIFRS